MLLNLFKGSAYQKGKFVQMMVSLPYRPWFLQTINFGLQKGLSIDRDFGSLFDLETNSALSLPMIAIIMILWLLRVGIIFENPTIFEWRISFNDLPESILVILSHLIVHIDKLMEHSVFDKMFIHDLSIHPEDSVPFLYKFIDQFWLKTRDFQ